MSHFFHGILFNYLFLNLVLSAILFDLLNYKKSFYFLPSFKYPHLLYYEATLNSEWRMAPIPGRQTGRRSFLVELTLHPSCYLGRGDKKTMSCLCPLQLFISVKILVTKEKALQSATVFEKEWTIPFDVSTIGVLNIRVS